MPVVESKSSLLSYIGQVQGGANRFEKCEILRKQFPLLFMYFKFRGVKYQVDFGIELTMIVSRRLKWRTMKETYLNHFMVSYEYQVTF